MNWGLILSIAALVLAIPLAIIANIITPKISDWVGRRNKENAEKRISDLKHQQKIISEYRKDSNKLLAFGIISILRVLMIMVIVSITNSMFSIISIKLIVSLLDFVLYFIASVYVLKDMETAKNILCFEGFNDKIESRLKEINDKVSGKSLKKDSHNKESQNKSDYIKCDNSNKKEFFIFYASAENSKYKNIWDELSEGSYTKEYLQTKLSQDSINRLIQLKKQGNLSEVDVLGLYYKCSNSYTSWIIKLLDFEVVQDKVNFSFKKIKNTNIVSNAILKKLNNMYSYHNQGPQLIVRIEEDLNEMIQAWG